LDGARLEEIFWNVFADKPYEAGILNDDDMKGYLLGDISALGFKNVDFCLYIQNRDDDILKHIGPQDSGMGAVSGIIVGSNPSGNVYCGQDIEPLVRTMIHSK